MRRKSTQNTAGLLAVELRMLLAFLGIAVAAAAACRQSPTPQGNAAVRPTYNPETGQLERISYDRNTDGKPDAWLFMEGTRIVRAELDDNHDGKVDRWEHYGDQPVATTERDAAPRGQLVKAEQSTRFDGQVSRWETYERGTLAKVEEDTTGDGRPDKWETWADGTLQVLELDTLGTGRPNRRIDYSAGGSSPHLLIDRTGNGTFVAATP
jgi:hypothetical protein